MKQHDWLEVICGGALLILGISVTFAGNILGLGTFITGGASIFIFGTIKRCIYRKNGGLFENTITQWKNETRQTAKYIRKLQRITFDISSYNYKNVKYLLLKCKHEYTYEYGSCGRESIIIDTFNDIAIAPERNKILPDDKKTQFIEVTVSKSGEERKTYHRKDANHSSKFSNDEYGRPRFKLDEGIKLNKGQKVEINFEINNTHELKSNHLWYFEQISDELTITVNIETSLSPENFKLLINHPERDKLDAKDHLDKENEPVLKTV